MNRSTLSIALLTILMVAGCSSNSDEPATDDNTEDSNQTTTTLPAIRADVLNELAGYQSEALAEKMYELAASIESTSSAVELPGTIISNDVVTFTDTSTRNNFDCQLGGTLIRESISTNESSGAATESNRYDSYVFDQCLTEISGGTLSDGNYEFTGSYIFSRVGRSSPDGTFVNIATTWDAFNLQQVDGVGYDLTGTLLLTLSSNPASLKTTRESQIVRYAESSSDATTLEVTDTNFFQELFNVPPLGGRREIRVDGSYTGSLSPGETLQILTNAAFTEESDGVTSAGEQPLTGGLQISSTDGGVLMMTANGPLTVSFLSADGTTSESILEELPEFDVRGPGCVPDGGGFETAPIEACPF